MEPKQVQETNNIPPEPAKTGPGFLLAFKSLSSADFRTLWFGMLFNIASLQINIVARSWLAYDLSGSALVLGIVALARGLPQIIFSPLGGGGGPF